MTVKPFHGKKRRFEPGHQRALYSKVNVRSMARVRLEVLEKKLLGQSLQRSYRGAGHVEQHSSETLTRL